MLYNLPFQLPTSITGHCTHILAIANAAIAQYRNGHGEQLLILSHSLSSELLIPTAINECSPTALVAK